jgi:hypothetical protein
LLLAAAAAAGATLAHAATLEEDAAAATREWAKAVMARDVESQLTLLPPGLFAKAGDREKEQKKLMHEKEMALINNERYVSFDVQPKPLTSGKVGKLVVMVFPYRSVWQVRDTKLQRDSSLIAIADEGSSKWSVIDGTAQNPKSMKAYLPGYAGGLSLPRAVTTALKSE